MFNEIKKNKLLVIITLIGWVGVIVAASFNFGVDIEANKNLRFDTPEQKIEVISFSREEFVPRPEVDANVRELKTMIKASDEKFEIMNKGTNEKLDLILEIVKQQ